MEKSQDELVEMLTEETRNYLRALQCIAEMVGIDTSREPAEGVYDVMLGVEEFARRSGSTVTIDDARRRCGDHRLNEARERIQPSPSAHSVGVAAYHAVITAYGHEASRVL